MKRKEFEFWVKEDKGVDVKEFVDKFDELVKLNFEY